jgi:bifunctional non-homologous end joining protein LigD
VTVKFGNRDLTLSNLEKVFYPKAHFTKAHVLDYYQKISPVMLPHLRGRMLTLKRYPEGVEGEFFYEKRCPSYRPSWMKTKTIQSKRAEKEPIPYCQMEDLAGMVWVVNLASLEFHILLSTEKNPKRPTVMVFDLDPGAPADFSDCCRAALKIKKVFQRLNLEVFAKTSGGKGLHLYVPLNNTVTFDHTKSFAHSLAGFFEKHYPDEMTSQMKKNLRGGKVFIDWSQNDEHKTTVCVYSLRARERPTVSTPLKWTEVAVYSKKKNGNLAFETEDVIKRVKKYGDLFAPVLTLKQKLPAPIF